MAKKKSLGEILARFSLLGGKTSAPLEESVAHEPPPQSRPEEVAAMPEGAVEPSPAQSGENFLCLGIEMIWSTDLGGYWAAYKASSGHTLSLSLRNPKEFEWICRASALRVESTGRTPEDALLPVLLGCSRVLGRRSLSNLLDTQVALTSIMSTGLKDPSPHLPQGFHVGETEYRRDISLNSEAVQYRQVRPYEDRLPRCIAFVAGLWRNLPQPQGYATPSNLFEAHKVLQVQFVKDQILWAKGDEKKKQLTQVLQFYEDLAIKVSLRNHTGESPKTTCTVE